MNELEISKVIAVRVQIFEKIMFSERWNILTSTFQPIFTTLNFEVTANVGATYSIGLESILL